MVDDKVISDGALLFLRRVGVRGEGGQQGGLLGLLAHGLVDKGGTFGGDFGAYHFSGAVHPDVHDDGALFGEIIAWTVQALRAAATEAIARAVALAAVALILFDACQPVGLALIAGLSCDAF